MSSIKEVFADRWAEYWIRRSGLGKMGRFATWLASLAGYRYKDARRFVYWNKNGFVSPRATIPKKGLNLGKFVFIDDEVTIYRSKTGGAIQLGDESAVLRHSILEADEGGEIRIGAKTWIHPDCKLIAALNDIRIGSGVLLAANCALYPHNHGIRPGIPIIQQPCNSKGPIEIGDGAWLGTGVVVLSGVTIGDGAVIGAGSVVTKEIPPNAVAFGVPARVVKMR
jgi:acetyltransferase-like isoleucine patch superfamily enzyme